MMEYLKETLFDSHPHPMFVTDNNYNIVYFNNLTKDLFPEIDKNKKCYDVIYGQSEPCNRCIRDFLKNSEFYERHRLIKNKQDKYITAYKIYDSERNPIGYLERLQNIPSHYNKIKQLHDFILKISNLSDKNAICIAFTDFINSLGFAVRFWKYVKDLDNIGIQCEYVIETKSKYVESLKNTFINSNDLDYISSFEAINLKRIIYFTGSKVVKEYFLNYYCDSSAINMNNLYLADKEKFPTLAMYTLSDIDKTVDIFSENKNHDWLDIPILYNSSALGKISVSPISEGIHFSRNDMETFILSFQIVNNQLFRILTKEKEHRRGFLEATHETRHAHQSALSGIEYLQRRIESIENEEMEYGNKYILQNLENSIRLMTFLNEYPNIEDSRGNYNKDSINFHKDIVAPIVNLVRHIFLNELLSKDIISFPKDYNINAKPKKLNSFDELKSHFGKQHYDNLFEQMKFFGYNDKYNIYYSENIKSINFFINPYRLQCVLYNLISNSLKYRDGDNVNIAIFRVESPDDFVLKPINLSDNIVIRISDMGLGIGEKEIDNIFELSYRGIAAEISSVSGYGKGLFISKTIMKTFGGDIYLNSFKKPTSFDIIIPKYTRKDSWNIINLI